MGGHMTGVFFSTPNCEYGLNATFAAAVGIDILADGFTHM